MRKEKFVWNSQTLQYEKVKVTRKEVSFKIVGTICMLLVTSGILVFGSYKFYASPKEKALKRELNQLEYQYGQINSQLDMMTKVLDNIQDRDANVHRSVFGIDPLDDNIWESGIGGADRYADLTPYKNSGEFLLNTKQKVDKLENQLYVQSMSLDTLERLAVDRKEKLSSIPSIKPVRVDKLKRKVNHLSGFGMRMHPVHEVRKFHKGIDFTAPSGTAIQATGNGKVKFAGRKSGYGKTVIIDHGYGYETLYAHMKSYSVKKGEKVDKGMQIGKVGSTGTSTASHCHYEVKYKGKAVNPIHYVMDGLSAKEYQELVERAKRANQSFD